MFGETSGVESNAQNKSVIRFRKKRRMSLTKTMLSCITNKHWVFPFAGASCLMPLTVFVHVHVQQRSTIEKRGQRPLRSAVTFKV